MMSMKSELKKIEKIIGSRDDDVGGIDAFIFTVIGKDLEVVERFIKHRGGSQEKLSEEDYQAMLNDPDRKIIRWSEGEDIDYELKK
jgi:hypothetical protein